jgi:hypothetical protein
MRGQGASRRQSGRSEALMLKEGAVRNPAHQEDIGKTMDDK